LSDYANNPFKVRIIAVANGYDAMILDRPYRCALASRQVIQSLLEGRDRQWDANVVNAFVDMMSAKLDIQPQETPSKQVTFPVMSKTIANSS
jgi:HD-GYP domain-containing protein (c-di-GMP phosphodiesterase class II)